MIGFDLEAVALENLMEHSLQRGVVNFLFLATLPADKMVVRLEFRHLIVGFVAAGVGSHDEPQIDEEA